MKAFRQSAFKEVTLVIEEHHLDYQSTTKSMMNLVSEMNPPNNSCHYLSHALYFLSVPFNP